VALLLLLPLLGEKNDEDGSNDDNVEVRALL
jgi:hypothetical protein